MQQRSVPEMGTNFESADCFFCHKHVARGAGHWNSVTYCNEACEDAAMVVRTADAQRLLEEWRQGWINVFIPQSLAKAAMKPATWEKALLKITNGRTADLNDMTYAEVELALEEANKRADAKTAKVKREALKSNGKCLRCGGAGQADKWVRTGLTCYSCNGSGTATPEVKF